MHSSALHCQNPVDFQAEISVLKSPGLVKDHFQDIVSCYGGLHILMCRLPQPHEAVADCILMDTRPAAWAHRHRSKGYMSIDPLVKIAHQRGTPCTWSEAMTAFKKDSIEHEIHQERLSYGSADGLLVPIQTKTGYSGLVSISAKDKLTDQAIHALSLMSLAVHNLLSALLQSDSIEFHDFTSREIECLKWVAAGKSDTAIATILDLSSKTVNFHVEGAKRRINAATRAHAVASAIRIGLID